MRWKWLLLLTLITISFANATAASNEDEDIAAAVENINETESEKIADNHNDENYDDDESVKNDEKEKVEKVNVNEELPLQQAVPLDKTETVPTVDNSDLNDDTIDVEPVQVQKTKGKYMNYDDYVGFNLDVSDSNYNWNGKSLMNESHIIFH
jgi:high-affinity K+ transport system ATPase subunit B